MGTPNKPCNECPFLVENRGKLCPIMVDQMEINAIDLAGFPCHKRNPGNDILTCSSPEKNADDCIGYSRMRMNQKSNITVHPEVVGCFDELMQ